MLVSLKRVFKTTFVDLRRNKYITMSSISVMTLVYLVLLIFSGFAFASMKFLNYVETREHLEVFFNPQVEESSILAIKTTLEQTNKTEYISYTNQEQAAEFLRERHKDNPLILGAITPEALPASLAIRAKKIDYVPELKTILEAQDSDGSLIYKISYNEDVTSLLKDLLMWVRIFGGILFVFLIIVVFLVSLITVEISITSRKEEISIMQLVGGGKWFIRAPFILQGVFYGMMGALLASLILTGTFSILKFAQSQSPTLSFISRFFSDLEIPKIDILKISLLLLIQLVIGSLLGGVNSFVAVLRRL